MILRFKQDLCNTIFPNRFERIEKDGSIEMIRLVEGTTDVVEANQPPTARPKEFKTGYANIKDNGEAYYQVEITDKAILNYLQKTPYWGKYINEYDPLAVSKKESEEVKKDIAILAKISSITDDTELLQVGYALFGNEALSFGKDNNYEGLRVKIFKIAMNDSETVNELLNSTDKQDFLFLAFAFAKGIIEEGDAGNSVVWGDQNRAKIISVPYGVKPIDALVEYFATSEGREVKQLIGMKLEATATSSIKAPTKTVGKAPAKA